MTPDMNDLPSALNDPEMPQQREAIARLADEVEALRLQTPDDNVRYWLSDEAMQHD